ncbi:MAG: hypothetical protein E7C50_00370 [Clostridium sp.]|uniref:pLS20_p028 family conjugation system transmembrane protein n=1 Tax=Clostridium sp. TaxID=1506 RepID=UPI0029042543|nr:hypothetical protein [Clostridium sp.]MDU2680313.1 hypothetical protein [Clostridium sp.]
MLESLIGISEGLAIDILTAYDSFFTKVDFFINCFRTLGWWIIRGLAFLVGKLEDIVNEVTFITDFFESAGINALITKFKPVLGLLLVFSIIFIGYQLMFNKKYDRSKIPMNAILALCVVVALPIAMTKLNDLTDAVMGEVKGNVSITKQIVSNNVTDLYLLDEADFPMDENKQIVEIEVKNNMGGNILNINLNEEIDRSKVKSKNKKVFENEVFRDKNGVPKLSKINGLFKWDDEYYRFSINFFTIICTLFITAFVLIFTAVKIVKLSIELAFSKIMTTFVAVADLSGGQKLRQSVNGIISIFVSIFATTLMLKLYILATAFFTNRLNSVATILAMFGAAIFVIDGPNYIEKIFGVDAGLSSAWRAVTGLNSALDIMNKLGNATGNALEKMKDLGAGALNGLSFAKGMAEGAMNKPLEDEMEQENSENENNTNETLDSQMENEANNDSESENISGDNQVNEDIDSKDGDNSIENNSDDINSEEDSSDNLTSLDEDIENEQANYRDEDLNNDDDVDSNNSEEDLSDNLTSLDEDIENEQANYRDEYLNNDDDVDSNNSEEDLSDNLTSLDEDIENEQANYNEEDLNNNEDVNSNNNSDEKLNNSNDNIENSQQSLEDSINANNDITNDNEDSIVGSDELNVNSDSQLNESSNSVIDDMIKGSNVGVDEETNNNKLLNGEENLNNGMLDENSLGNNQINNDSTTSDISNESSKDNIGNIENQVNANDIEGENNNNIGYENPIEDRNIYQIKRDQFKSKFDDLGIQLGRSYTIGKNTGRDIRKFASKDKKGDKK